MLYCKKQTGGEPLIDIQKDIRELSAVGLMEKLLADKTTGRHILWATDAYETEGEAYGRGREIELAEISLVKTRARKAAEQQSSRTRRHGEVFTPRWVCDFMNDALDRDWFGVEKMEPDVWEDLDALFWQKKGHKTPRWQRYVDSRRLEITCGEAPYLAERYDVSTGEEIEVSSRRGLLDRKLLAISHFTETREDWQHWALRAMEATYGYEFQGDNLLIARVNIMKTVMEHYFSKWEEVAPTSFLRKLTNKVAWNLWQMDGLSGRIPYCAEDPEGADLFFFGDIDIRPLLSVGQPVCRVYSWRSDCQSVSYEDVKARSCGMRFDYIVGNPPYQEDTNGAGRQARPLYNVFFEQAKQLNPKSISLITPSRWFSGGMGLNSFREAMMNGRSLKAIFDYTNAKDCFPGNSISGGVSFFIWDRDYNGDCKFVNVTNGVMTELKRPLNEFPIIVRYNQAVDVIHKVQKVTKRYLTEITSGLMPFGLSTNYRGTDVKTDEDSLTLYATNGVTYISEHEIDKGLEYLGKFKVLISKTGAEHAGEPSKDGKFRVIPSSMRVIGTRDVCTHSYFLVGKTESKEIAENILKYMKTQFVRFLMLMAMSGFGLSKNTMIFVPIQDFTAASDIDWTKPIPEIDRQLYAKYGLDENEISFIEKNVKEMK